jgi:hypothetical protein
VAVDIRRRRRFSALFQCAGFDRSVVSKSANVAAPTQSEPPFLIAQGVALTAFLFLGIAAAFRLRPAPAIAAY